MRVEEMAQVHYLDFSQDEALKSSIFNSNAHLPPATRYEVRSGDTLYQLAEHYGIDYATFWQQTVTSRILTESSQATISIFQHKATPSRDKTLFLR